MKLIFVRHGQTDFNKVGKLDGLKFDMPLNEEGVKQARETAGNLSSGIDLIFSSPSKRAAQTAETINERLGLRIEFRDELREYNPGTLSGKTWEDIEKESGSKGLQDKGRRLEYNYHPWGGESIDDVRGRLMNFINEMKEKYAGRKVLVVTHGGIMRIMHADFPQKERPEIGNATIHEFNL